MIAISWSHDDDDSNFVRLLSTAKLRHLSQRGTRKHLILTWPDIASIWLTQIYGANQ